MNTPSFPIIRRLSTAAAFLALACAALIPSLAEETAIYPIPSTEPSASQKEQIARKYGMFIHFGINTFHDLEWTDGSLPASSYKPASINAEQWVRTTREAGMTYIILVAKHHDGFCLWDSKRTEYDVACSGNATDVIDAVARECKRQGIGLGLYYSLWDRKENADVGDESLDAAYNGYMIDQLNELIDITSRHGPLVELWFDGSWTKAGYRWPFEAIYTSVKSREPRCQIGINWNIGRIDKPGDTPQQLKVGNRIDPADQKEGDQIRYFPSDFRLGDPLLPADPDPKIFTHNGQKYYMPWESTVCMSGKWFYNSKDDAWKSVDELAGLYRRATAQDNILILNCPPDRDGNFRPRDIELLRELKKKLEL